MIFPRCAFHCKNVAYLWNVLLIFVKNDHFRRSLLFSMRKAEYLFITPNIFKYSKKLFIFYFRLKITFLPLLMYSVYEIMFYTKLDKYHPVKHSMFLCMLFMHHQKIYFSRFLVTKHQFKESIGKKIPVILCIPNICNVIRIKHLSHFI